MNCKCSVYLLTSFLILLSTAGFSSCFNGCGRPLCLQDPSGEYYTAFDINSCRKLNPSGQLFMNELSKYHSNQLDFHSIVHVDVGSSASPLLVSIFMFKKSSTVGHAPDV